MLEILFWIVLGWAAWWYIQNQYNPGQSEKKLLETKARLDALLLLQKQSEREERVRKVSLRERKAKRRQHLTIRAKELRAVEKLHKPEDRGVLKLLTREQKEQYCEDQGLDINVLDAWINLPPAELERRKMGLE